MRRISTSKSGAFNIAYLVIPIQPFTATDNPHVLGIGPVPNIAKKISLMIENLIYFSSQIMRS